MIRTRQLTRRFGRVTAVDAVDLEVPRHCVVGFLGPNGAGKTTALRMICGYLMPSSGTIHIDGIDIVSSAAARREAQRKIGYLPESAPLYTEMTVNELLRFRCRLFGIAGRARKSAIDLAVGRCQLEDVRRRPIRQLSKGYRQRVGLAAALLHQPPLLILDEPTVGLDPNQIRQIRALLRELAEGHTILLSTHILPEVELTCDRFILIAGGKVRASGSLADIRNTADQGGRVIAEVNRDSITQPLRDLPGVISIRESRLPDDWLRLTITGSPDVGDLGEAVGRCIQQHGVTMRELRHESHSLEQLFVDIVTPPQPIRPEATDPEATTPDATTEVKQSEPARSGTAG